MICGFISLVVKKGGVAHKRFGRWFFYCMLVTAIISAVVANMPNHKNYFLFSIGLFSSYFLISGYRSVNFRKKEAGLVPDKVIAVVIVVVGLTMILYPVLLTGSLNIVLLIFGMIGLLFGARDLSLLRNRPRLRKAWLRLHLGKMSGGYIAAITAFLVVNQVFPGIWNWFIPTILGTAYITYWTRKTKKAKAAS